MAMNTALHGVIYYGETSLSNWVSTVVGCELDLKLKTSVQSERP